MNRTSSLKLDTANSKPDLSCLRRWIIAFCAIRFDLEQGQVIEECYPAGVLTQDEELEVAFNSFPDSVSQHQHHRRSSIHDSMFFFRFTSRRLSHSPNALPDSPRADRSPRKHPISSVSGDARRYVYGYVFNRQRQDERLKRGGEQKSVVILSYSPYSAVFKPMLQILGPLFFDIGKKVFEHVASYVSMWPVPALGTLMELPIGNAVMKVYLPPAYSLVSSEDRSLSDEFVSMVAPFAPTNQLIPQGLFHDADIFGIYRGILLQLWMLWELLLIGEPLLIIAPTPPQCCEAVASLVSLVAPLPCSIDFRPYFTIHDPDFARLNSLREGDQFPPMVLGVTNLFFLKALRSVPHVVSVGNPAANSSRPPFSSRSSSAGRNVRPERSNVQQLSLKKFSPTNLLNAVKIRRDGPLCLMTEHKEAVWSTYAAIMKPDTGILNRLIDAGMSPRVEESMSVVNNEILRRHFLELTTNFLAPFGPYLKAATPSEGASPFVDPPPLPPFNVNDFLDNLAARGPGKFLAKRMRANWLDLYRRFLKGQNFMPWFQKRRASAAQQQQRLWRQARMKAEIRQLISRMSELEIVDSFNAIERFLLGEIQKPIDVFEYEDGGYNWLGMGLVDRIGESSCSTDRSCKSDGWTRDPQYDLEPRSGIKAMPCWSANDRRRSWKRTVAEQTAAVRPLTAYSCFQLQQSGRGNADSAQVCQKLKGDLQTVFNVLPKDMQQLLLFNPQRATLLQGNTELTKLPGGPSLHVGRASEMPPRPLLPQEERLLLLFFMIIYSGLTEAGVYEKEARADAHATHSPARAFCIAHYGFLLSLNLFARLRVYMLLNPNPNHATSLSINDDESTTRQRFDPERLKHKAQKREAWGAVPAVMANMIEQRATTPAVESACSLFRFNKVVKNFRADQRNATSGKEAMMMEALDSDLTAGILSRLPLKSLLRCPCVRKLWRSVSVISSHPIIASRCGHGYSSG
ncbi:hypothetical protein ACLOJK_026024 [Asimina triloba]